ncbi:MAG: hypothetical protein K6F51_07700 [Acetatifactor sp.]|nr:hypothetical protein [Acetatifactor sp.]
MRKIIALFSVLIIIFAMSFPVKAADESLNYIHPELIFSGTTATCSLTVYAERSTDSIVASVTLKQGNSIVKQWSNLSSNGYVTFSDTATVSHGVTYTMHVTVSINGVSYPVSDITKTCP